MDKIIWLQPEDTDLGKKQRRNTEMSGSPTFCVIPWIHIATRPNGQMRLCCTANASGADTGEYDVGIAKKNGKPVDFGRDTLAEAFNGPYIREIRKKFLNGEVPASCVKCFNEEQRGMVSKRIWEGEYWVDQEHVEFKDLIANTDENGAVPNVIRYMDLRLGFACQLKCVTCTPHDSSGIVKQHQKLFPMIKSKFITDQCTWQMDWADPNWFKRKDLWDEIYEQIPNITNLYFAGGEPLIIQEHKTFLMEIIKQGRASEVSLRYNTNGLTVSKEWIDIWSQFKHVLIAFSLDAVGDRLEYIRFPTKMTEVEAALSVLESSPDNIEVQFAIAVQLMNIKHMPDFIKWRTKSEFTKPNYRFKEDGSKVSSVLRRPHLIWIPSWYNLRALPDDDKAEVRLLFENLKGWLWDNHSRDPEFWKDWEQWEGILNWMDSDDQSNIAPYFREYMDLIDQFHHTNFDSDFPELAHLRKR